MAKNHPKFRSSHLADLFADVVAADWRWRRGRHVVIYPPDGSAPVMLSVTAFDGKATQNLEAMLRRHGLPKRKENR
jgi:hypothetical protein